MSPELLDSVLLHTDFPDLELHASGKVRDIYRIDNDRLLFVATDRISAFDYVLATGIPLKGAVLTQISLFWFDYLKDVVPNHVITADVSKYPDAVKKYADQLRGRSLIVTKAEMYPVECVVRGYLSGSGWKEYQRDGKVCGIALPKGLKESDKLPEPIFTPATKATTGHDINISFEEMCKIVGAELGTKLRDISLKLYTQAADYALTKGIIIADTKFEFGMDADNNLVLADEVFTPDSSRYWPADEYRVGVHQRSFDKQFIRNWLSTPESGWDRRGHCPPPLPPDIVAATRQRYLEAYERISGQEFAKWIGGPS